MQSQVLEGGFADPAIHASRAFRSLMDAVARPGAIRTVTGAAPPAPLSIAAGVAILTLCDADTPIHLAGGFDTAEVRAWIAFHTSASFVGPSHCMFALGCWQDLSPLSAYPLGTSEHPDRSATLIVEMDRLSANGQVLRGPGIRGTAQLSLPDAQAIQSNHAHFPRGLDFFFTCTDRLAALPRSTEVL